MYIFVLRHRIIIYYSLLIQHILGLAFLSQVEEIAWAAAAHHPLPKALCPHSQPKGQKDHCYFLLCPSTICFVLPLSQEGRKLAERSEKIKTSYLKINNWNPLFLVRHSLGHGQWTWRVGVESSQSLWPQRVTRRHLFLLAHRKDMCAPSCWNPVRRWQIFITTNCTWAFFLSYHVLPVLHLLRRRDS